MQFLVDYQKLKPDLFARARLQVLYDSGMWLKTYFAEDKECGCSSLSVCPFLVLEFDLNHFFFSILLRAS
jgi:hypothetical protein